MPDPTPAPFAPSNEACMALDDQQVSIMSALAVYEIARKHEAIVSAHVYVDGCYSLLDMYHRRRNIRVLEFANLARCVKALPKAHPFRVEFMQYVQKLVDLNEKPDTMVSGGDECES